MRGMWRSLIVLITQQSTTSTYQNTNVSSSQNGGCEATNCTSKPDDQILRRLLAMNVHAEYAMVRSRTNIMYCLNVSCTMTHDWNMKIYSRGTNLWKKFSTLSPLQMRRILVMHSLRLKIHEKAMAYNTFVHSAIAEIMLTRMAPSSVPNFPMTPACSTLQP